MQAYRGRCFFLPITCWAIIEIKGINAMDANVFCIGSIIFSIFIIIFLMIRYGIISIKERKIIIIESENFRLLLPKLFTGKTAIYYGILYLIIGISGIIVLSILVFGEPIKDLLLQSQEKLIMTATIQKLDESNSVIQLNLDIRNIHAGNLNITNIQCDLLNEREEILDSELIKRNNNTTIGNGLTIPIELTFNYLGQKVFKIRVSILDPRNSYEYISKLIYIEEINRDAKTIISFNSR
jgi:hypothetical protein